MITRDDIAKEYYYDDTLGALIRITNGRRRPAKERSAPYSNVVIKGQVFKEHRAIWILHNGQIPDGFTIDHKDGNPRNNKIENLRLCTPTQNNQNKTIYSNSTTGFKGVHKKGDSRYSACIQAGRVIWLGVFDSAEEAAEAYDTAALKYFGEFARTNKSLGLL